MNPVVVVSSVVVFMSVTTLAISVLATLLEQPRCFRCHEKFPFRRQLRIVMSGAELGPPEYCEDCHLFVCLYKLVDGS